MSLSDAQKKRLDDVAIGDNITSQKNIYDQIAALRKQIAALSEAAKVPLEADFKALEDLVASEKEKVETIKPTKKTVKKSS